MYQDTGIEPTISRTPPTGLPGGKIHLGLGMINLENVCMNVVSHGGQNRNDPGSLFEGYKIVFILLFNLSIIRRNGICLKCLTGQPFNFN